jgi:hypothetical protein
MEVQPHDFRYSLTYQSKKTQIVFAPKGWDADTVVSYARSDKYFGMLRSMSLPLTFVLDGAKILRQAYYKDGIEAGVKIEVEQLNRATYQYQPLFTGDIDFSKFKDLKDNVSVTLMESGVTRDVKAYESVKFEYPLAGDDVVTMELPGVVFDERADCLFIPTPPNMLRFIPETTISSGSFQSGFVVSQNTQAQAVNDTAFSGAAIDNWFIRATRDQSVRVQGRVKGNYFLIPGGPDFTVFIKDQTNTTVKTLHTHSGGGSGSYEFEFNELINMTNGQKLYFYFRTSGTGGNRLTISEVTAFSSSYDSVSNPSLCKGIRSEDLYRRILKKISPGTTASSFLLRNTWGNLIFTSGDGVREIDNAKIKITFKEFYDTINGIDDAGFGVENGTACLENSQFFARNMPALDLGEVKDCIIEPADDYIFNSIKIGYDDGNTDEPNGKQEYNSGQEWALPITRIKKEKDWTSPTRADQYGIEKIRVDYNVKKTAAKSSNDTSSDNDTFMVDCYLDGETYKPILGSSYQSVTGLASGATAYNLAITPKKNLLRHGAYLRSIMDKMDSYYINFASAEKNAELKTVLNSVGVKENENILVTSLPEKYFTPIFVTVKGKMPIKAVTLIDRMPFGYISFKWKNATLKGYIIEVSLDIAKNSENEIKLLLTHDNNLLATL